LPPNQRKLDRVTDVVSAGENLWTVLPAASLIQQHAATFADFPPRQAPPAFNPQAIVDVALKAAGQRGD
jgi:arylsulfatase